MRYLVALMLVLVAAPAVRADVPGDAPVVRAEVVESAARADAPAAPEMMLEQVSVAERRAEEGAAADAQDMPRRGSFWWLVGVIVVAGVILALLLD